MAERVALEYQVRNLEDLRDFLNRAADGGKVDLSRISFYPASTFQVVQDMEAGTDTDPVEGKLKAVVRFD